MKLHFINQESPTLLYALAEIREEDGVNLMHSEDDYPEIASFAPKRKLEFLATRALMKQCCAALNLPFEGIQKDEFGKPFLINLSAHISISHSYPLVACMINTASSCGIDIEAPRSQLLKIRKKFLNNEELTYCGDDLKRLCIHWASKEALYKIYGRKRLVFSDHLKVKILSSQSIAGAINFEQFEESYELKYESHQNYILVHSL